VPAGNGGFIGLKLTACWSATNAALSDPEDHITNVIEHQTGQNLTTSNYIKCPNYTDSVRSVCHIISE